MMIDLSGKVALVTGGARGIGRGICLTLAEQGADVAVADLLADSAASVAVEMERMGRRSQAISMDVTSRPSIQTAVSQVLDDMGRIDILVNNAGVVGAGNWWGRDKPSDEDWHFTHMVNVRGVVMVTEAVQDQMIQRGSGRIVNIASIAARQGSPDIPHYSTTKAAVVSWTQSNAHQLAPYGITVNAICPGLLWTDMWQAISRRRSATTGEDISGRALFERAVENMTPMKREQTPEDIGKLAAFLASDDARNITGQAINVDGGIRMN
ncbi:MAG: glucose 1-dehydrogenase [Dehalococcoidia bacterium]|nr:glucose 1-dehydrogenase [Dehalococcoidia bacterium]